MARLARAGLCALLLLCLVLVARAGDEEEDTKHVEDKKDIVYKWTIEDAEGNDVTPSDYTYKLPDGDYQVTIEVQGFNKGEYYCDNLYLDWTASPDNLRDQLEHAGLKNCYPVEKVEAEEGAPAGDNPYAGYFPVDDYCKVSVNCTVDCDSYPTYDCTKVRATFVEPIKKDDDELADVDYKALSVENFPDTINSVYGDQIEICTECKKECPLPWGKYTCDDSYDPESCLYDYGKCVDCHLVDCERTWILTCDCPVKCPKSYKGKGYEAYGGSGYTGKEYSSKTYKGKKDNKYRCHDYRHINLESCKSGAVGWDIKKSKLTCLPKNGGYGYSGPGFWYGHDGAYKKGGNYNNGDDYPRPTYNGDDKPSPDKYEPEYQKGGDPTYDNNNYKPGKPGKPGKGNSRYHG